MTVIELCSRLLGIEQARMATILAGSDVIPNTDFNEALTPKWLADNIKAVFEVVNRKNAREGELVGPLETNAFLAAFQKAYENSRRTRINRWAHTYSSVNAVLSPTGPLGVQLPHIGAKVEDEWLTEVIKLI
jgi:hypothetical protein